MPNVDGNLSIKEKEWLETATKYVSSKHLPVLGKMLKIVDDVSLTVGRAFIFWNDNCYLNCIGSEGV